jgi:hypothetical protein
MLGLRGDLEKEDLVARSNGGVSPGLVLPQELERQGQSTTRE